MSTTNQLREDVRARLTCPLCGRGKSIISVAKEIGVSHDAVYRFLAGYGIRSSTLDKLETWLEKTDDDDGARGDSEPDGDA